MNKINLAKGSLVFYKNEQYRIKKPVNFNKILLSELDSDEIIEAPLNELTAQTVDIKKKEYIDHYSDKEWETAKKRYEIIKDLVFKERTKEEVINTAIKHNYSYGPLYNWINIYEQTGEISSLVPKKKGKEGSRLDIKVEEVITEVLDDLYLNKQRHGFRKIYNRIYNECKAKNLESPHENTIRLRIEAIDPKLAMKKRNGYKAAKEKFDNFEGEFPEGKYPLEFVQIDHTPLDIIVVDKVYREPLGRPYLTLAIDVYSRMIAGMFISLQPPGYYNVSQCLYSVFTQKNSYLLQNEVEGEWNIFGIPRVIGVDNGADLVSSDMQRVCDEFGITLMKRPVARPQFGAHVERVLGTINKEVHNLSGTTFSNIFEKGEYDSKKEAMFTVEELTQWITYFIVNIYHKKKHSGIEMTPEEKYEKGVFGDDEQLWTGVIPSIIEDTEYIKIALLPTEFRTVQKDGITLDGVSYYSDVLRHWIGRKDKDGSKIKHKIKRDPMNIQKVYFFDSELKEYFEVPYRKLHAPVMTLWDLYAAKRYLKDNNISKYTEDDIFDAYNKLEDIENSVKDKHKEYKKKKKKIVVADGSKEEKTTSNAFDALFNDIELFEVK